MNPQSKLFPPQAGPEKSYSRSPSSSTTQRIFESTVKILETIGDDKDLVEARLAEIDQEWSIEKALHFHGAALALVGLGLGKLLSRRWYGIAAIAYIFQLQEAQMNWSPPYLLLRRLGFRTQREIYNERAILKTRRGDFRYIGKSSEEVLRALSF